jgi:hypothetical protein
VRTGRKEFDQFESMGGDVDQVFAGQAFVVIEMGGHSEAAIGHPIILIKPPRRPWQFTQDTAWPRRIPDAARVHGDVAASAGGDSSVTLTGLSATR